jgi:hypothetical protein
MNSQSSEFFFIPTPKLINPTAEAPSSKLITPTLPPLKGEGISFSISLLCFPSLLAGEGRVKG